MSDLNLTIFGGLISLIALAGAYVELLELRSEGQLVKHGQARERQPAGVELRQAA